MTARTTQGVPGVQVACVPADATLLEGVRAVVCLTPGNLIMQGLEGVSLTYAMTAGMVFHFSPRKIMTATTGTYALWR